MEGAEYDEIIELFVKHIIGYELINSIFFYINQYSCRFPVNGFLPFRVRRDASFPRIEH